MSRMGFSVPDSNAAPSVIQADGAGAKPATRSTDKSPRNDEIRPDRYDIPYAFQNTGTPSSPAKSANPCK